MFHSILIPVSIYVFSVSAGTDLLDFEENTPDYGQSGG